eukprot:3941007-Rhodomonas_salina.5
MSGTDIVQDTRCPVPDIAQVDVGGNIGKAGGGPWSMQVVPGSAPLRAYAISGTDIAYGVCVRY